jgi:hypothetical protein
MEDTRYSTELVHVLRHSFEPSAQLGQLLETLLPPRPQGSRSFYEIKSLSMIALNAYKVAHYKYTLQLIEAQKALEASRAKVFDLHSEIEIKKRGEKTLEVFMGLNNPTGMQDLIRTTQSKLPEGIALRSSNDSRFSVFAQIHSSTPIDESDYSEAQERMAEIFDTRRDDDGKKYILSISPKEIVGSDQFLKIPLKRSFKKAS